MSRKVSDEQKEANAISLMQTMLCDYSKKNEIPFDKALDEFSTSKTYVLLFDFKTELWSVGENYLLELYEEELKRKSK